MKLQLDMRLRICTIFIVLFCIITDYTFPRSIKSQSIEARCIWVTRWDYSTKRDIDLIIRNAVDYNFNVIFFQVRGAGTVYYKSLYESFSLSNWNDSDPLKYAIDEAHKNDIQLHAWINVYPGWAGLNSPTSDHQLFNSQPGWFMTDITGERQELNQHYVWLSPTHPEVQLYLKNLVTEIIENYDVDGLHLDYIRYPGPGYSYDIPSLKIFSRRDRKKQASLHSTWDQFRRDGISILVENINSYIQQNKPHVILSSAVLKNYNIGKNLCFQDSYKWLAKSIIDFTAPMIYTNNMILFQRMLEEHIQNSHHRFIFPGINAGNGNTITEQIELSRNLGVKGHCLFSYQNIFPDHQPGEIARLLKASSYKHKSKPPDFYWKKFQTTRPVVKNITFTPFHICENTKFNIQCTIPKLPKRSNVYVLWSTTNSFDEKQKVPLTRLNGISDDFITSYEIPAQEKGTYLQFRIFVENSLIQSNVFSKVINGCEVDYVQDSNFDQLIYDAQFIAVDPDENIWICELAKNQVRIISPNGTDGSFSPVKLSSSDFTNGTSHIKPYGIAIDINGTVYITGNSDKHAIYVLDSRTGKQLQIIALHFWPGEIDVDKHGYLYVIEADGTCWHVFDNMGKELANSPVYGSHISKGIAVNNEGTHVYVACQAEGTVHCWEGKIQKNSVDFIQIQDLPAKDVGLGTVDVDDNNNIFVSHIDMATVSVYDQDHKFKYYLSSKKLPLKAPKGVAVTQNGKYLFIVDWGIESGTQLQRWKKVN